MYVCDIKGHIQKNYAIHGLTLMDATIFIKSWWVYLLYHTSLSIPNILMGNINYPIARSDKPNLSKGQSSTITNYNVIL